MTHSLFPKGHYPFPEGNAPATHGSRPYDQSDLARTYLAKLEDVAEGMARSV